MLKFSVFISSLLLLISSLAMGTTCVILSDQKYRDILTSQNIVFTLSDREVTGIPGFYGTATINFKKNGTYNEHIDFTSNLGSGTIDISATWSVQSATLYSHIQKMKHSDTGNKQLNSLLDAMIKGVMRDPNFSESLMDCSYINYFSHSSSKSSVFLRTKN